MKEKHNILIYYYRNVKKYTIIKYLKFFLDIQQRFIGAIFVLILLNKNSLTIVIFYCCYIGFFYISEHNAQQLKVTSLFIVSITLIQYTIVLLKQEITRRTSTGGLQEVMLIDYIYQLIISDSSRKITESYESICRVIGIIQLDETTLLYDSIPTILFQFTLFYYDFFLLY